MDIDAFINQCLTVLPRVKDSYEQKVAMTDLYESRFGIYDHLDPKQNRPLASVALLDEENICNYSTLLTRMDDYIKKGVWDAFKISFLEMIERPRYEVEMILAFAEKYSKLSAAGLGDLEKGLGKK